MMKNPEGREDERVVNRARACPDIGQSEWADDDWILGKMLFVIPNESGIANARVGEEDQEQEDERAGQTQPPRDNARFAKSHCLTDGVGAALLSTPCSDSCNTRPSSVCVDSFFTFIP